MKIALYLLGGLLLCGLLIYVVGLFLPILQGGLFIAMRGRPA